jgi:lipopolysaccharide/colanic/teichoic acid biosynthesis glycosyltransferase
VPQYVDYQDPAWHFVLAAAPGITDFASLVYRHEEELLAGVSNVEDFYRYTILPAKLALNISYLMKRSWWRDLEVIAMTILYSLLPASMSPARIQKLLNLNPNAY